MLLGVLNTPAVRRSRTVPPRSPRTGWRGKGRCRWIHLRRKRCRQKPAKLRSAVDSLGSPTTTRRRRLLPLWFEDRAAVRTLRRPLLIGCQATFLPHTPSRRVLERQGQRRRLVGPGEGSSQRRTDAPICKLFNLTFTLPPIFVLLLLLLTLVKCRIFC